MDSSIYFVRRADGAIKIGYSTLPRERFRTLSHEHGPLELLAIRPGTLREERALHSRFAADALGGEWFRDSPDLQATVRAVVEEHGPPDLATADAATLQSALRMPRAYHQRADALLPSLERERAHSVTRTDVLREAIAIGIAELERRRDRK